MSDQHHIMPVRVYVTIFLALMVLTAITVAAAFVDLGAMSDVVAMAIAGTKASLVVLYFMHVRYSGGLVWASVIGGIACMVIMFLFTMSDVVTRTFFQHFTGL